MMDHTRHGITADIDKNLATWGFKKKKAKVNHYIEFCASFSQIGIIPKITHNLFPLIVIRSLHLHKSFPRTAICTLDLHNMFSWIALCK